VIEYLVGERHASLDEGADDGSTPLHVACYYGCLHAVRALLSLRCVRATRVDGR
jgi:ankyrin repeat protein